MPEYKTGVYCIHIHYKIKCKATLMHHLTTGIHSEKWVIRQFRRSANVTEGTYTNLDSMV